MISLPEWTRNPPSNIIGELGFDGLEMIVTARRDLKGFWTDARVDRYKQKLEQRKLQVSQFVLFQPVVEDLSSLKPEERNRALDYFQAGCRIGKRLGAPIVNIVAPWAQYVETTRACLARAKAFGLKFSIEQHTHTLMPEAASFRRLWDSIRDPDLGYNLDAGWTLLEREYPPVAIYKVRRQLLNLHMRDINGLMRRFVPFGEGVMDYKAIAETLKQIGFTGFASLEQDKYGDMQETCKRYLRLMRECLG